MLVTALTSTLPPLPETKALFTVRSAVVIDETAPAMLATLLASIAAVSYTHLTLPTRTLV